MLMSAWNPKLGPVELGSLLLCLFIFPLGRAWKGMKEKKCHVPSFSMRQALQFSHLLNMICFFGGRAMPLALGELLRYCLVGLDELPRASRCSVWHIPCPYHSYPEFGSGKGMKAF